MESVEKEVMCLEKEDKLKFLALIEKYNKVLSDVNISSRNAVAAYKNYVDRDKVASMLVTSDEMELKYF